MSHILVEYEYERSYLQYDVTAMQPPVPRGDAIAVNSRYVTLTGFRVTLYAETETAIPTAVQFNTHYLEYSIHTKLTSNLKYIYINTQVRKRNTINLLTHQDIALKFGINVFFTTQTKFGFYDHGV